MGSSDKLRRFVSWEAEILQGKESRGPGQWQSLVQIVVITEATLEKMHGNPMQPERRSWSNTCQLTGQQKLMKIGSHLLHEHKKVSSESCSVKSCEPHLQLSASTWPPRTLTQLGKLDYNFNTQAAYIHADFHMFSFSSRNSTSFGRLNSLFADPCEKTVHPAKIEVSIPNSGLAATISQLLEDGSLLVGCLAKLRDRMQWKLHWNIRCMKPWRSCWMEPSNLRTKGILVAFQIYIWWFHRS